MADYLSPRPLTVVTAAWVTMVWCGFAMISSSLALVALLLVREGMPDIPFVRALTDRALWIFVAAFVASGVGLQLGTLVWRRSRIGRWGLLVLAGLVAVACPFLGRTAGPFFGVPVVLTILCLLAPSTSSWFASGTASRSRRVAAPERRPVAVSIGCGAALSAHGGGIVMLVVALGTLATTDPTDHELAEFVDPINAQTWGLALLLVFVCIHLGIVLAALLTVGRSSVARLVVSVASGVSVLIHGGGALTSPAAELVLVAIAAASLVAVALLATPRASAWFRDAVPPVTDGAPEEEEPASAALVPE